MHITSIDVMSLNGKITKGADADAHTWSSKEDWEQFKLVREAHEVLIMGRGSYESVRPKPEPGRLRVVLTHHPEEYDTEAVPGQLEFINQSPEDVVQLLEKRGFTRVLLVGGRVNTQFSARGLVNEMYVTIEPFVFGKGRNLLDDLDLNLNLQLESMQQLNNRGTLFLHYKVLDAAPIAE